MKADAIDRPYRRRKVRGFVPVIILSTVIHVGAIGGMIYLDRIKPSTRSFENAIPVQLVRLGKKRDPNLLPRMVAPAPPPASEGVALDKSDKSKANDKREKKSSRDEKLSDAAKRLLQNTPLDDALKHIKPDDEIEGDPNGVLEGTVTDAANAASGYALEIAKALKANYRLPESIPASERRFLQAQVVLLVESNGAIREFQFLKEHPNKTFMAALEVLLKSLKLPPPPRELAARVKEDGIVIIFKP